MRTDPGHPAEHPGGRRHGGLLRQRNFMLLWFGETVSQIGSAVAVVGVPLLAVVTLHATTFIVGVLGTAGYLPWLIIGLPAGAWVDRLPPRAVMISCDIVAAVVYASIPAAAWAGALTIGQLIAVQLVGGGANVMFSTAYQVYLPSLVKPEDLVEGNAKLQGSSSAASLGGRGLAGLIAQVMGTVFAMLLNASSFLVSAICLITIGTRGRGRPAKPRTRLTLRRDIAQGIVLAARDPYLRPLSVFSAVANFALVGYQAILVVFFVRVAGIREDSVGVLMAVPGIGGLLGAVLASRVTVRLGTARALLLVTLCTTPFGLLLPLTEHGPREWLYVGGILVAASGVSVANIIIASFRQKYCPAEILGRITATMRFVAMGSSSIGALCAGALGTWLGLRPTLWILLAILAVSGTSLLTRSLTGRRDLPVTPSQSAREAAAAR